MVNKWIHYYYIFGHAGTIFMFPSGPALGYVKLPKSSYDTASWRSSLRLVAILQTTQSCRQKALWWWISASPRSIIINAYLPPPPHLLMEAVTASRWWQIRLMLPWQLGVVRCDGVCAMWTCKRGTVIYTDAVRVIYFYTRRRANWQAQVLTRCLKQMFVHEQREKKLWPTVFGAQIITFGAALANWYEAYVDKAFAS